jgi:hypothetical protein
MYFRDRFLDQALEHKHTKYDPLVNTLQSKGWKVNPLIAITTGVKGAIHELSTRKLIKLNNPKSDIKTLMKNIHQNAVKYFTYSVLTKEN